MSFGNPWTEDEIEILRRCSDLPRRLLAPLLPRHPWSSIRHKRFELRLGAPRAGRPQTRQSPFVRPVNRYVEAAQRYFAGRRSAMTVNPQEA